MDIRVLQYFVAVAQEGSITGAAESLFITQPTLSRQIKDLENELGVTLLHRGSREVTLTEDGQYLYNRALEILSLVRKTTDNLAHQGPISGTISIGAAEGRTVKTLFDIAKSFQDEYNNVNFDVFSGNADDILEKINAGILDLGVISQDVDHNIFNSIELPHTEHWGVLMPKDHPLASYTKLSIDDLVKYPLIISNQSGVDSAFTSLMKKKETKISASFNLAYNASLMVEAGMGLAIIWSNLIHTASDSSNLAFVPLDGTIAPVALSLIWKRSSQQSHAVHAFVEYFQKTLQR